MPDADHSRTDSHDSADTASFQRFVDEQATATGDSRRFRLVSLLVGLAAFVALAYLLLQ